ncbi:MAG: ABC transporter substrate-binding protein, partial [Chloroflexota bacterium]|nr:ABC transporter substrate-binding protein [Chloroflexota bacterium]
MRVAQSADIQSLDPWNAMDDPTITVLRQVYEGLVDLEPGGFKIVPKLADSWTVSSDARVWTFRLHPGVTFHDGSAFDAQSVATNFGRGNAVARFGVGALISSVQVPDPATVVITLRTGYAPFLASLASGSFGIVNPVCLKLADWATAATACAQGTGPFLVRPGAWRTGESVTLQRNPTYWGRDADGRALPYVDTLVFRAFRDDSASVAELRAATVSVVLQPAPSSLSPVRSDPNLAIRRRPSYDVSYLGIGTKPLESPDVRRAIAMAIDRGAIVQTVYG